MALHPKTNNLFPLLLLSLCLLSTIFGTLHAFQSLQQPLNSYHRQEQQQNGQSHHLRRQYWTRRSIGISTTKGISSTGATTTTTTATSTTRLYAESNKKNLKSFQRYLEIECWKNPELRQLEPVLRAVTESCRQINRLVQRAHTDDLYGVALGKDGKPLDDTNIQGEVQQQLDVLCNTYMLRAFCGSGSCIHAVASEEEDESRCCSDVMVRNKTKKCFLK